MGMSEELLEIVINGPGPYGFRLYGGDGDPLIVAKLRARSKSHDAGLREGDVVLGINGRTCQAASHGIAMTLLESAEHSLRLHLYRGSKDKASISSAYDALGHQLRPVSPGTLPPNRSIYSIQPSPAVQPPAQHPSPHHTSVDPADDKASSYSRQEVTSVVGDGVTQTVTTETQDLGGVTLTKVTRHVVKEISGAPQKEESGTHPEIKHSSVFHVPKFKVRPLVWTPEGATSGEIEPGSGRFRVNKTITVDLSPPEGKENVAPEFVKVPEERPKFRVQKTSAKAWAPGFVPSLPDREPSPDIKFEIIESHEPELHGKEEESDKGHDGESGELEEGRRGGEGGRRGGGNIGDAIDPFSLTPDLIRVLTTEGPHDELSILNKKKKIFANSSFYDDPEHKYPTIEEQIKMARKVALSLSDPDNVTARGQRMFLKRKEKASRWTSDMVFDGPPPAFTLPRLSGHQRSTEPRDLFYNPTPWNAPRGRKVEKVVLRARREQLEGYPEDVVDSAEAFAKHKALFDAEVKVRPSRTTQYEGKGKKIPGAGTGTLAPQMCIGLVNDLKEMKGRGAQLFARLRAKAIEEEELASEGEWEIAITPRARSEERGYHSADQINEPVQASASRLEELISISKAYMSPWESSAKHQLHPWETAETTRVSTEELPWRPVQQQRTDEETSSFIRKRSTGTYRPVRFHVPGEIPETDF